MLVSLFLLAALFLALWRYFRTSYWSSLGIPEVRGLPLFGNLLPVFLRKQAYFQLQQDIYSSAPGKPYVGMYNLSIPTLIIRDPALVETMLMDHSRNFDDHGLHPDPSDPLSMNMFYLTGKQWKWVRSKLRSSFSTSGMKNIYPDIQRCVDEFLVGFNGQINLKQTMDEFTCEVFAKAVFCIENKEGFVQNSREAYNISGFSALRVLLRMFFPKTALALGVHMVPQKTEDFFRNAMKTSTRKPGSFVDQLFKLKEENDGFDENLTLAQFFIFILAGFETTSTALIFCVYLLAKHPEIQMKARKEIIENSLKHGISFEALKEMTYLDCVIKEALRLYSPVASIMRLCGKQYRLPCGTVLPPGTPVVIPYLSIHNDPELIHNPSEFMPERWTSGDNNKFFNPFGLGPRNCIGMQFALLEMKAFLTSLLRKSSIKLHPSNVEPMKFEPSSFFIVPKHPLNIIVESNSFSDFS